MKRKWWIKRSRSAREAERERERDEDAHIFHCPTRQHGHTQLFAQCIFCTITMGSRIYSDLLHTLKIWSRNCTHKPLTFRIRAVCVLALNGLFTLSIYLLKAILQPINSFNSFSFFAERRRIISAGTHTTFESMSWSSINANTPITHKHTHTIHSLVYIEHENISAETQCTLTMSHIVVFSVLSCCLLAVRHNVDRSSMENILNHNA